MKNLIKLISILVSFSAIGQIKIGDNPNTINSNSILELESTNKGLLLPRVALTATTASSPLSSHTEGMSIYNTATTGDVTPGYYYNDGTQWIKIGGFKNEPWYGTDDNGPATLNTENIYTLGDVGVGVTTNPRAKLDITSSATGRDLPTSTTTTLSLPKSFRTETGNIAFAIFADNAAPWGNGLQSYAQSNGSALPLILQPAGGRVGIGTHNPGTLLHLTSAADPIVNFQTSDNGWLYTQWLQSDGIRRTWMGLNADLSEFHINGENGTNELIFEGVNVGIGTTAPSALLDVAGAISPSSGGLRVAHSNATQGIGIGYNSLSAIGTNTNQHLNLAPKGTGGVGIGTAAPAAKLDVVGNVIIRNRLQFGNAATHWLNDPITGMTDGTFSNDAFLFVPVITGSRSELRLYMTDDNDEAFSIWGGTCTGGNCADLNAASQRFKVRADGLVTINNLGSGTVQSDANGNLSVSSDERLKKILNNFDRSLESLKNIQPIQYNWNKTSGLETEGIYTGFSAQNIKENIPEAIGTDQKGYLTLDNRPIIATLVNSVKELQSLIQQQQKEIEALKKEQK